jgi:acetoacetyl-CoA synthetase
MRDLSHLRALGWTGSPLGAETHSWFNTRFAILAKKNGSAAQADM